MITYEHPEVVPIIDGYVEIDIPSYDITVRSKVRQVKGRGVHDAIDLKKVRPEHKIILRVLISNPDRIWLKYTELLTSVHIYAHDNKDFAMLCGLNPSSFDKNGWMRYCSELLAKKILVKRDLIKGYKANLALAEQALYEGVFA
jgi:hypothetical protein